MSKIFLSYSRKDEPFVEELYKRLTRDGIDCFFDKESILWGTNWVLELEKGIDEADILVLILSPDFCASEWTRIELSSARLKDPIGLKRRIRPLILKPCDNDIPPFLRSIQSMNVSTHKLFEKNYPKICEDLGGTVTLPEEILDQKKHLQSQTPDIDPCSVLNNFHEVFSQNSHGKSLSINHNLYNDKKKLRSDSITYLDTKSGNKISKLLTIFSFESLISRMKLIINSAITIGIIVALFSWYLTIPPAFVIKNQTIKYHEPIIIKADNSKADKPRLLNVMFDEMLFEEQAFPIDSNELQAWHFSLKGKKKLPDMLKPGKHQIKVGFPGDKLSEAFAIELIITSPQFIILNPNLSNDAIMIVKADNDDANINKKLHVEFDNILFPESGLPVDNKNRQLWHCNFKNMRLTKEMKKNGKHKIRFRFSAGIFSKEHTIVLLNPSPAFVIKNQTIKFNEPIIIKADNSKANKPRCLNVMFDEMLFEEQAFPIESKGLQVWHFLLKDQKKNLLADILKPGKHRIKVGFPGDKLSETFVIVLKYYLRHQPKTLTALEFAVADSIVWSKKFIDNDYVNNGDGTVTDRLNGLMWQQGGSENEMDFSDSKTYILRLNRNKFSGYSDWRLPTIDELHSLLERNLNRKGLYIDPIFSHKQIRCWSADAESLRMDSRPIYVNFKNGLINKYFFTNSYYVRAVRSLSDNNR